MIRHRQYGGSLSNHPLGAWQPVEPVYAGRMKANRWRWLLLFLFVNAVFQLSAQQSEADRKLLADIRGKAEKDDAQAQCELGAALANGRLGLAKDDVEAVKWLRKAAEQNNATAQYDLSVCYDVGQG